MKVLFAESHDLDYRDPLGSHQYIRLFREAGHDCLWLGPAVSPLHIFKADRANRHRFRVWLGGRREVKGIGWLVPMTMLPYYDLPFLRSRFAGRNHYRFCLPPAGRLLKKAGFGEVDILWCAGPVAVSLLDIVPHRVSCFRLADRLDQFSRIPASVKELTGELIRRVDLVLATSRELWEFAREIKGGGAHYLPNGVSEFFFGDPGPAPPDWPDRERPAAVFVGTVDSWFDLGTLEHAVSRMADFDFLVIGSVKDEYMGRELARLSKNENFNFLGARAHAAVPAYLKRCSVGMIPFKLTPLTHAINPIKYYEYLACGLPVVASPMRELLSLGGPLHGYDTPEQFCSALRRAASAKAAAGERLVDFARDHTWRSRFAQVMKLMEGRLS